jgi:twitching motility protein PilT
MEMDRILKYAVEKVASDIHLTVGRPPMVRVHGRLIPIEGADSFLESKDTEVLMKSITADHYRQKVEETGGTDFGFSYGREARFRVSVFKQKGCYGLVLRQIPKRILSFEEIGVPLKVKELLHRPRGLILVVGPTGCGKTTTLATMLDYVNTERNGHILTIEDPIEYFHEHKNSIVNQREVGVDVISFQEALVKGLRQDPDVILVGEMRDLQTMEAAISAAETGHLVMATLHTTGAARTVDRIIDAFPAHQQAQIRTQLASSITAIISQLLLPTVTGESRVAVIEFMVATSSIQNLIREGKTFRIISDIQTGARFGMRTFDTHLLELYAKGLIDFETALPVAYDPEQFTAQVKALTVGRERHR